MCFKCLKNRLDFCNTGFATVKENKTRSKTLGIKKVLKEKLTNYQKIRKRKQKDFKSTRFVAQIK